MRQSLFSNSYAEIDTNEWLHSPIERSRRGRVVSPDPSYFIEITRVDLAVIARGRGEEGGGGSIEFQLLKTRKSTGERAEFISGSGQ